MTSPTMQQLLSCSRGDTPADLVFTNARIINPFIDVIVDGDVAICGDRIAGIGRYQGIREINLQGALLCPGFIEGHIHIESSMLSPDQFARAVVPHGTSCVICDPHEIANVAGLDGVFSFLAAGAELPLSLYAMAPSCVPATHMETGGAVFGPAEISALLDHPAVLGLAEMMNFPGTIHGDQRVLAIIDAARAQDHLIDGHAPGLTGHALQAYIAAGVSSDHECVHIEEARAKLQGGMYLYIREGSSAHNLEALLPLVNPTTAGRCLLVSDDRHADDLLHQGHLDAILRKAIRLGLDPLLAIRMVTLTPASRFGLHDRGAIAPGYRADLVILDDLQQVTVQEVYHDGVLVSRKGTPLWPEHGKEPLAVSGPLADTVKIGPGKHNLAIPAQPGRIRVIDLLPNQIVTGQFLAPPKLQDGCAVADPERDILKIAVLERHHASGNLGLGFVRGFGLRNGAMASTVAHDSHNLVVVGTNDVDMLCAVRNLERLQGGLCLTRNDQVLASLQLDVAGLMSSASLDQVCAQLAGLRQTWLAMGCPLTNPFMQLSFLALPVIPSLKITDKGIVDVTSFHLVSLWI